MSEEVKESVEETVTAEGNVPDPVEEAKKVLLAEIQSKKTACWAEIGEVLKKHGFTNFGNIQIDLV